MTQTSKHTGNHSSAANTVQAGLADAASGIGAAMQTTREDLGEVVGKVAQAASEVTQQVREHWDEGLACGREMKEKLESSVKARPMTSLALAAGAGLLLGLLWSRR